jgi:ComEC/Rec2-related protein
LAPPPLEIDHMSESGRSLFYNRPALIAVACYIPGVLAASFFEIPYHLAVLPLIVSLGFFAYLFFRQRSTAVLAASAVMLFLLGAFLASVRLGPFPPNHISNLAGERTRAQAAGHIIEEPDIRPDKTYLVLDPDSLKIGRVWIPTLGRLRVRIKSAVTGMGHGDYVQISGYLYSPSGATNPLGFDYNAYLRAKEIFAEFSVSSVNDIAIVFKGKSLLSGFVAPVREIMVEAAQKYLRPDKAAILTGFILGERSGMNAEHQCLFRDTGTMHLMAVSGSNVGLLLLIVAIPLTFMRIPRRLKAAVLIAATTFFALLTRLEPSVVRASVMALIGIMAYGWLRKPDPVNLLAFAALVMLLWRPLDLFDVGFQLSFAAAFGIIYGLPRVYPALLPLDRPRWKWLHYIIAVLAGTLVAQIAVLPLVAHYFHRVPLIGAVANLPVIALATVTNFLGIALFAVSFFEPLANLIAVPLGFVIDLILACLRFFAAIPYSIISVSQPGWAVILMFWATAYFGCEAAFRRRSSASAIISSILLLNVFVWGLALRQKPDWRLEFLDLGRNRAWIFSGHDRPVTVCFDSFEPGDDAEDVLMPYLLARHGARLDYLFTATPESPEVAALTARFSPVIIAPQSHAGVSEGSSDPDKRVAAKNVKTGPPSIKVLWDWADNITGGVRSYPAIEIDVDIGACILAGWAGMGNSQLNQLKPDITLMEFPWSHYARSSCLQTIEIGDPEFVVFSPDRHSVIAPRSRRALTHSKSYVLAASLVGAFAIERRAGKMRLLTMKPLEQGGF